MSNKGSLELSRVIQRELYEKINQHYYVLTPSQSISNSLLQEEMLEFYHNKFSLGKFEIEYFEINSLIERVEGTTLLFDLMFSISSSHRGEIVLMKESFLRDVDYNEVVEVLSETINSNIPHYAAILSLKEKDLITIDCGQNYDLEKGLSFEILNFENDVIGTASIDEIYSKSSQLNVKFFVQKQLNNLSVKDLYLRSIKDKADIASLKLKLSKLKQIYLGDYYTDKTNLEIEKKKNDNLRQWDLIDNQLYEEELSVRKNDWILVSLKRITGLTENLKGFFSKSLIAFDVPIFLSIQWNLNKTNYRPFIKTVIPILTRTFETHYNYYGIIEKYQAKSRLFEVGLGIERKLFIYDVVHPSIGISLSYLNFKVDNLLSEDQRHLEEDVLDKSINGTYHGIDIEVIGGLSVRIINLGAYGNISYHFIPYLINNNDQNISASLFSIGFGTNIFF